MKKIILGLVVLLFCACSANHSDNSFDVNGALKYCSAQTNRTLKELEPIDYTMMPRNIMDSLNTWSCRKASKEEWTSGFWPGILWYDYEATKDPKIKAEAEKFTASLGFLSKTPAYDHDLGFLVFCSYGNAYRLTKNPVYKKIILDTADSLATLFNPKVGTILSWPREVKARNWPHNTIMDNMINLEMLFWAAKNGGDKRLYDIAVSHANKTMKCQFRPDYSSYHVAVYDTVTGNLIKGVTHQGYADNSMWARGQAWAIYGFTVCYRETKNPEYLSFVQKVTDIYLKGLPEDNVPYWDFSAPDIPKAPRDASAACVVASALLELSTYLDKDKSEEYKDAAVKMLKSLSSPAYQCGDAKPAFLLHSTGHWPNGSEIDASIIYADYYYIEALLRFKKLNENKDILEKL
ncbi:unsaturated chondroitin disaccharide hydrolase [Bacteroides luti]|uniref:Unsaturated chondroitin disaccharide hydrolase n=1 Tax=Bacteroides luti TaxID=1297750 RepID=A0A1M5CE72_9BACE|nr:glycoside hydrolase family 88 protein [Bacteroides luti]SHF52732.1 unsaturated chondroitin disaccharide hydrolase [Bacteroides luti]